MDGKYTVQDVIRITSQHYKKSFNKLMVAMPSEYAPSATVEIMDAENSSIIGIGKLTHGENIVVNDDGYIGVNLLITDLKLGTFERKVITANVTYDNKDNKDNKDNIDINN